MMINEITNMLRPTHHSTPLHRLCELAKSDWKQDKIGEEEESWATKAIESLLKKMKKEDSTGIDKLERALNHPELSSECVTIQRSLDGRLQVNHKKGLPHVIYCRVWRWPDLQTHQELTSLPLCRNPYNNKNSDICVNPYHYARVEAQILPPVLVPRKGEFPPRRNKLMRKLSMQNIHNMCNAIVGRNGSTRTSSSPAYSMVGSISHPSSPYSCVSEEEQMHVDHNQHTHHHSHHQHQSSRIISPGAEHMEVDMMPNMAAGSMPVFLSPSLNQFKPPEWPADQQQIGVGGFRPDQLPKPSWCTISYYEMNSRVGEMFIVNPKFSSVTVDGFTNPSSRGDRFCLGTLSNINRGLEIQRARDCIGKGIKITNYHGDVYIQSLSDHAVFVRSFNCNHFHGFHKSAICKIPPDMSLKVFDNVSYQHLVQEAHAHLAEWGERCAELQKMPFIHLSFARGWGTEYQRQNITSTPCWIEIRLNHQLKLYDTYIGSRLDGMPMSSVT